MPLLEWTEDLALNRADMDQTHREFVALIGQLEAASDHALLAVWREFVAHTEAHFAQEDASMVATHFGPIDCHTSQHGLVLHVLRQATAMVEQDSRQLPVLRAITRELAKWFTQHTAAMDAPLAQHLARVGFDPATGTMASPVARPSADAAHGCEPSACHGGLN